MRNWLRKHGKAKYIDFDDKERQKYRAIFSALDIDGSGSIEVKELEEPLIALGLANSRDEIERLVKMVDIDGTQEIEFDEFLMIMKEIKKNEMGENSSLYFFFRGIRLFLLDNPS
jgi:Ca2+-binding EF-hand superfamily protein